MGTVSPTHALLGLLARGDMHGYDLKRLVDQEFAPFWRIDFAQLYRSLAKMNRAGWIRGKTQPGVQGPKRKTYTLTAAGRKELFGWLETPGNDRGELFVKLALASERGVSCDPLIRADREIFERGRAERAGQYRDAQEDANPAKLIIAQAALKDAQAPLAALDLASALVQTPRGKPRLVSKLPIVIAASDDPLLSRLAQFAPISLQSLGSIGGLIALAQHHADMAGAHLFDQASGEYNTPFVKHLLPEEDVLLVNLAMRETGLIVAPSNPLGIRDVYDLARKDVRLINRTQGTGTRLLLFDRLRAAGIDPHSIKGWDHSAATHDAVAAAVACGAADVGPGLRAVAHAWKLGFIPLSTERYDLIIPRREFDSPHLRPMLEALHSREFRSAAAAYVGYDLSYSGSVIAQVI